MSEETQIQQEETNPPTQSYISRVRLKGYKSIIDTEVTFKPGLNIIIGANGSGKTNFVEFLGKVLKGEVSFLSSFYSATIEALHDSNKKITYYIDYILKENRESRSYKGQIKEQVKLGDEILKEYNDDSGVSKVNQLLSSFFIVPNYVSFGIEENFSNIKSSIKLYITFYYSDNGYSGKISAYTIDIDPKITDGLLFIFLGFLNDELQGISSFIDSLENDLNNLKRNLKLFTKIQDIRLNSNFIKIQELGGVIFDYLKLDFLVNDKWLTWNQLSDGTKRMFYIITEITFANNIVLLEEPELGIHPHQLSKLMDFLKEQSEEKQIIITTHSPQVLNILDIDELDRIIVANYDKEKGTLLHHLSEEEMEHARSYMETEGLFLSDYWVYSGFEKEEE